MTLLSLVHTGDKIDFDFVDRAVDKIDRVDRAVDSVDRAVDAVDFVDRLVDLVDFNKIDCVEVDFVASVYEALYAHYDDVIARLV